MRQEITKEKLPPKTPYLINNTYKLSVLQAKFKTLYCPTSYLPVVRVYSAQSREALCVCTARSREALCVCVLHGLERHCVCTARSREALCVCTAQFRERRCVCTA